MPKPYSTDLRERAVEAVESGASRREAAEIFKVGVSSVIRWCRREGQNLAKITKPTTIETMKGPAESGKICSVEVEEK
jgi:transposase